MTVSLFELSVPTFLQTVRAIGVCLDKTRQHCSDTGRDPDELVTERLIEDMTPFHFQIECVAHHSFWTFETIRLNRTAYPRLIGEMPFSDLQAMVSDAASRLEGLAPDQVNSWSEKKLDLEIGTRSLTFTSENFLLSFALPNFFFHATTAYNILRARGVPLGKHDFEGRLRTDAR